MKTFGLTIRGWVVLALACASGLASARADGDARARAKVHVVKILNMQFVPAEIHIARGDIVRWENGDIFLHAVKSTNPADAWQSKDLPPKASWERIFTESDAYLCPYHPTMLGRIVVDLGASDVGEKKSRER